MSAPARLGRWPMPALAAWVAAWASHMAALALGVGAWPALGLGACVGLASAGCVRGRWRRCIVAGGFPVLFVLLAAVGSVGVPGWVWAVPLALLVVLYPRSAWRDAPFFPTPRGGLRGLGRLAPVPPEAKVLDAGCGGGAGLRELRTQYPHAQLVGIEQSWPLMQLARLRMPGADVRRGDFWDDDWSAFALVYLFQRPESMAAAARKARAQMPAGAWLVSLEFAIPGWHPAAVLRDDRRRAVWIYRMGRGTIDEGPGRSHKTQ